MSLAPDCFNVGKVSSSHPYELPQEDDWHAK